MRRLGIVALGFSSVLLGLAGGMNVHRLVDLDQTTTWLHRTGNTLQSSFEATRKEVFSRISGLTSSPTSVAVATEREPWQNPSRNEAVVRVVGDLSKQMDQLRAANDGSARDLGQGIERIRSANEASQRELVAKLAELTERVERVERRTGATSASVVTPTIVQVTPKSPPPKPVAKPVIKSIQKPASAPTAKIAVKQTPPEAKPRVPRMDAKGIANWTVRDVFDDTAVLKGPGGLIAVGPGDTIPGIGRIEAIMRSGGRWVVATTKGVITPRKREFPPEASVNFW
jgi:hypothetical protein